jgi:nicotinic acid mononucleotide adenylyltransferase/nicotinamide mononucleotide (NMN) deamidase PncC
LTQASQQQLAQQVHASGRRLVIVVTGGASQAIATLLGEPGASRSILAATVPYAPPALVKWLGAEPDEFCSSRTARAMAMRALLEAQAYDPRAATCGVAATASLASDRPKRGPHRVHLAWQSPATTAAWSLELKKGARSRAAEEALASALVLNAVAEACAVSARLDLPLLADERVEQDRVDAPADQQELLAGRTRALALLAAAGAAPPRAVFPGAFDPLHVGHRRMVAIARQTLGCEVALEISIDNVDKPPLDFIEINRRVRQFSPDDALWLTRAPTFAIKAELFPGATFIVGADTIERIGQERYYGHPSALAAALEKIAAQDCRFLVFGRVVEGRFCTLARLNLPPALAALCREVPESAFREDISSTQIRRQQHAASRPDNPT